jgi:hypothetical protein
MKKIILALGVGIFSMTYSQNLNFTDTKFKALLLSSSPSNQIAKDINGNFIAIDTSGDGEIQNSEAQQVKVLNLKQDPNQMYINPNGNTFDPANINIAYYNSHLPDGISDALLFSNLEELYFWDTKTANISFVNNSKIKKVQGRPIYYDFSQSGQQTAAPINLSFDNCTEIHDISNVIAYQATMNPWAAPENSLTLKNCPQINGPVSIDQAELKQLYIQDLNISTLTFNSCKLLEKISVPNLNTLTKISILGMPNSLGTAINQNIDLIANNCVNLQEIIADTDHYDTNGAYFSSVNLNGCTNLKTIKGLNAPSIDFSTAGLTNLEELDCAYYNRYVYNTTSGVYFGNVTSLNLAGLPKLKIVKAFNQPITNNVNFSVATALENIDITSSSGYMNTVNVSNLTNLTTLKTDRFETLNTQGNDDLQKITAKNCTALTNFIFRNNNQLKELDIQNCSSLQRLAIGYYLTNSDGVFPELQTVNLKQCTGLKELAIHNTKINALNTSECVALKALELVQDNLLPSVNISNNTNLEDVSMNNLPLVSQVNTSNNTNLKSAYFNNCPQITQLNFSNSSNFQGLTLWNMPNLTFVNIRNGSLEENGFDFYNYNSNLSMCVDDSQLDDLQNAYPDITFTTSCGSFLTTNDSKKNKAEIKIAPNPVKDFVSLQSEENIKNVKIYDAQGRIIYNQEFSHEMVRIDLSAHPSGVYLMKIKTDKTEISKKIMKQ